MTRHHHGYADIPLPATLPGGDAEVEVVARVAYRLHPEEPPTRHEPGSPAEVEALNIELRVDDRTIEAKAGLLDELENHPEFVDLLMQDASRDAFEAIEAGREDAAEARREMMMEP